jgi:hypothetical protein
LGGGDDVGAEALVPDRFRERADDPVANVDLSGEAFVGIHRCEGVANDASEVLGQDRVSLAGVDRLCLRVNAVLVCGTERPFKQLVDHPFVQALRQVWLVV